MNHPGKPLESDNTCPIGPLNGNPEVSVITWATPPLIVPLTVAPTGAIKDVFATAAPGEKLSLSANRKAVPPPAINDAKACCSCADNGEIAEVFPLAVPNQTISAFSSAAEVIELTEERLIVGKFEEIMLRVEE